MAPRYSHYLLPARGGRFPGRVLCLSVSGRLSDATGAAGVERSALAGWSAVLMERHNGAYCLAREESGVLALQFWESLAALLARRGTTWVVSPHACRAWALLGLWERLEAGHVTLRRPAAPLTARTVSAGRASREGTVLTEDPPSLLRCWIPGVPGTLVWMDPRNWGVDCSAWTGTPGLVARRCAGLVRSWCTTLQSLSLGSLQATSGSQALHGWLTGHYHHAAWAHVNPAVLQLEGDGLHGGRAEAHRLGKVEGGSYYLDIRSAYPWACSLYNLPVRLGGYDEGSRAAWTVQYRGPWNCLAEVSIRTDEPCYPVRRGPDTIYPVGRFRAVLPGPELRMAVERRHIVAIHRAVWYVCEPALQSYAAAVHEARCQAERDGNADLAACLKRLLVALPGKLAQRAWRWQTVQQASPVGPYGTWWHIQHDGEEIRHRCIAWTVQRCVPMGWAPDAVPAMSAWITSAVRVRLLEEIETAGWDNTIYDDTDGLIVNDAGYENLGSPRAGRRGNLGELTLRGVFSDLEIRGIKHYRAGDLTVCAGLPRGKPVVVDGKERWWEDVTPAEQIRRRDRPDALRELRPFERGPAYRHGVVGPDGRVSPIRLEEW